MEYKDLLKRMSLRKKISFLGGADFWHTYSDLGLGIPSVMVSDGPNGLRKQEKNKETKENTIKAVCFPSAVALASSWDRDIMKQVGGALADECIAKRISVLLGPGINIKRSPLCGRNFEYYSEDPVLAGEMAASYINGVQEKGIGTSLKHFAANNTELRRMVSDSVVDERALREIYLRGFEIAVKKAQPWTVMLAYNKLNGTYCTQNSWLIEDVLRKDWGFEGLTVSDWAAVSERVPALNAGLDLEMPGTGYVNVRKVAKAYREGKVSEETIDRSARRVLDLVDKSAQNLMKPAVEMPLEAHHKLVADLAVSCPVLLKNNGVLPVKPGQRVAVIGPRAKDPLYQGFGSAQINTYKLDSLFEALDEEGVQYEYTEGYRIGEYDEYINNRLTSEAIRVSNENDVTLVFVSCDEIDVAETADRRSISIPKNQSALISNLCAVCKNVAVILSSGSCVEMPWADAPAAIMQTYLLGEGYGKALAKILTGKVSPSGKLPESYPVSLTDTPCPENYQTDANNNVLYKESIFVGYRYYEKTGTKVLFPFGHGLSYSLFDYSGLSVDKQEMTPDDKLTVKFTIKNTGAYDAAEVAQLYIGLRDSYVYRAPKELKDFSKVYLTSGSSAEVAFELDRHAFEYYSEKIGAFVVEEGTYDIYVGSSSEDIRLKGTVTVKSDEALNEIDYMRAAPLYFAGDIKAVTDEDFADLLRIYPEDLVSHKSDDRVTKYDCLSETVNTVWGRKIDELVSGSLEKALRKDPLMYEIVYNTIMSCPITRFELQSHGIASEAMIDALVHLLNSGSVPESLKVAGAGIPDSLLNILEPMILKLVDKKSEK